MRVSDEADKVVAYVAMYEGRPIASGTAEDVWKTFKNAFKKEGDALRKELDGIADAVFIERGWKNGQLLTAKDIAKIQEWLMELKIEFEMVEASGDVIIKGYFQADGSPVVLRATSAAMFVTDGISKARVVLRENATLYQVFHELMHLKDFRNRGAVGFVKRSLVEKEVFVYEMMIRYKKYLTQEELIHANWYINKTYFDEYVLDKNGRILQVELQFDVSTITPRRKPTGITNILKLAK